MPIPNPHHGPSKKYVVLVVIGFRRTQIESQVVEGVAVIFIVLLNAGISVATEHGANQALDALKSLAEPITSVVRDGEEMEVPTADLVVGDVVLLETGAIVPADLRFVQASDVTVDESLLTGEALPVKKMSQPVVSSTPGGKEALTPPNEAFASCTVLSGTAKGVVVATGMATRVGRIADSLNSANSSPSPAKSGGSGRDPSGSHEKPHGQGSCCGAALPACCLALCNTGKRTPLQQQLHHLGLLISGAALCACVLVFIIGVARGYVDPEHLDNPPAVQMVLVAVSLAVSSIPEGLPLCVTIALALGTHSMAKQQALVKKLPSVETLGATTVICSDKTGTLTCNRQTAVRAFLPRAGIITITGATDKPLGGFLTADAAGAPASTLSARSHAGLAALLGSVSACSTASMLVAPTAGDTSAPAAAAGKGQSPGTTRAVDAKASADTEGALTDVASLAKAGYVFTMEGNPSEAPLVLAAAKAGVLAAKLRRSLPSLKALQTAGREDSPEVPFSSARKMMATVTAIRPPKTSKHGAAAAAGAAGAVSASLSVAAASDAAATAAAVRALGSLASSPESPQLLAHVKGAPDRVLPACSHMALPAPSADGSVTVVELTESDRRRVLAALDLLGSQSLRVIACAARVLPGPDPYHAPAAGAAAGEAQELSADDRLDILLSGAPPARDSALAGAAAADAGDVAVEAAGLPRAPCGLVFLGLLASIDPHRPEVPAAVAATKLAGVRTVMITGDHRGTAIAIAKSINILEIGADEDETALDCADLRGGRDAVDEGVYLPDQDLDEITSRCKVFARAQPLDKLMIVKSLQRQQETVAMTGDGVNDAPALAQADIGVGMGISGTEVAKGASDLILLDDSFATIVQAVKKGRQLFDNIRSFLQYLLGTNVSQVTAILVCVAAGLPILLKPLSILVINVMVDSMPAISLSVEPAAPNVMERQPRPRNQPILFGRMWITIFGHSLVLAAGAVTTFLLGLHFQAGGNLLAADLQTAVTSGPGATCTYLDNDGNWSQRSLADCGLHGFKEARTMVFIAIVFAELVRGFTVRSHTAPFWVNMFTNRTLIAAVLGSASIACVLLFVPGLSTDIMGFRPLGWPQWLIAIALGPVITVITDEVIKARYAATVSSEEHWASVLSAVRDVHSELRQVRHHVQRLEERHIAVHGDDDEELASAAMTRTSP